jgi:hypothetical protein
VKAKTSEADLAAAVVTWLSENGFDVYQEVTVPGGVADIVAVKFREAWIVEVKTSWSLDLLAQCIDRKRCANRVYAAVPSMRGGGFGTRAAMALDLGIGTIKIGHGYSNRPPYLEGFDVSFDTLAPRITRVPMAASLKLEEGHKTHAKAGAPCAAGRWTPFRSTCESLRRVVEEEPGLMLADAMRRTKHHYHNDATARSSMATWAQAGKVEGVRAEMDGKRIRLYPAVTP